MLRFRDVYPGSWFLSIPDPGSNKSNKRGGGKICCPTLFCSHKYHKIANYFIFEQVKKKNWANSQRIIVLYIEKIVTKLLKVWAWDLGSGKNLFRIPDRGVKKAPDPGSATLTMPGQYEGTSEHRSDRKYTNKAWSCKKNVTRQKKICVYLGVPSIKVVHHHSGNERLS